MKSVKELINQPPVFLHNWKHRVDVLGDFFDISISYEEYVALESPYGNTDCWKERKAGMDELLKRHTDTNILFASYGTDNWSGDAFVLFERNSALYEVNGSHCSCYGLEGQWSEEEITVEALAYRLTKGSMGKDDYSGNEFHNELCKFLGVDNT